MGFVSPLSPRPRGLLPWGGGVPTPYYVGVAQCACTFHIVLHRCPALTYARAGMPTARSTGAGTSIVPGPTYSVTRCSPRPWKLAFLVTRCHDQDSCLRVRSPPVCHPSPVVPQTVQDKVNCFKYLNPLGFTNHWWGDADTTTSMPALLEHVGMVNAQLRCILHPQTSGELRGLLLGRCGPDKP